jgi:hypothetical protein
MAPDTRYTAIPSSIWATDNDFPELSARAQWLYIRLWTSDDRDAAGFVPLQQTLWAKSSTTTSPETITAAGDELSTHSWVLMDFDAERAWLCRFIAEDTFHSPNQYISAMTKIRTCSSWMLRDAAWKEVQRLGLPPVKSANPEAQIKVQARMDKAYTALQAKMSANTEGFREGFRKGSERVSKLSNVNDNAHAGVGVHAVPDETLGCATAACSGIAGPDGRCPDCVRAERW